MLYPVLFFESNSLTDPEAVIYYNYDFLLYFDTSTKELKISFEELSSRGVLKVLTTYHTKGFMKFKDFGRVHDFMEAYREGAHEIFDTFKKYWGDWDLTLIKNICSPLELYSSVKKQYIDYPEFLLDTGEYLEEKLGRELEDGISAFAIKSDFNFLYNLAKSFLNREISLKADEIMSSKEIDEYIIEFLSQTVKREFATVFDPDSIVHLESEVFGRDSLVRWLKDFDERITDELEVSSAHDSYNSDNFFKSHKFSLVYLPNCSDKIKMGECIGKLEYMFQNFAYKDFYSWIALDANIKVELVKIDGLKITFTVKTMLII